MLKIFAQPPGASEAEGYIFNFTAANTARAEADAIKDALSNSIQVARADTAIPAASTGSGSSAAMAMASAISSGGARGWEDDNRLIDDMKLQQSLMEQQPVIKRLLFESLKTKPESIPIAQFTAQFWSTRVNLLRAHALEKSQSRGSYNVLATMEKAKKESSGGAEGAKMKLSREQVQLIFQQYPLVKKAYDETVPKPMNEIDFWSRFFQSRLLKKLRGEKVTDNDPTDKDLDKYLNAADATIEAIEVTNANVPNIIDVEKNEENHSQRKGNQPDFTMRPNSKVPIIRTLNALSEKIMAQVAPVDGDPSQPIGMDEETFNELRLQDLRGDEEQHRITLNIRDQSRFFSDNQSDDQAARTISKQNPKKVMRKLQADLATLTVDGGGVDLAKKIGWEDNVDSDEEQERPETIGSKSALAKASAQIIEVIRQRRSQTQDQSSFDESHIETDTSGLSSTIFDRLSLTHATTTEFLRQFWLAFLSGDPDRANEIASLVESLNRAMDRIKAVADDAEAEYKKKRQEMMVLARQHEERTGRKPKKDYLDSIQGGQKVVNQMMGPTTKAVAVALSEYKKALAREKAAMQLDG
jgi:transcription initiation factor TFIIH subunit 1